MNTSSTAMIGSVMKGLYDVKVYEKGGWQHLVHMAARTRCSD